MADKRSSLPRAKEKPSANASSPMLSAALRVAAAAVVLAFAVGAFWGFTKVDLGRHAFLSDRQSLVGASEAARSAEAARRRARAIGRAYENAQTFWAKTFDARTNLEFELAEVAYFSGATPTPCVADAEITGHFFCPTNNTASFDLTFAEEFSRRMRNDVDIAEALLVGHVAAAQALWRAGLARSDAKGRLPGLGGSRDADKTAALQTDCLTGVWAASVFPSETNSSQNAYGASILGARRAGDALRSIRTNARDARNLADTGEIESRNDAFEMGYQAADPSACAGN